MDIQNVLETIGTALLLIVRIALRLAIAAVILMAAMKVLRG